MDFVATIRLQGIAQEKKFTVGTYVQMPGDIGSVGGNFSGQVTMYCKTGPDTASNNELVWGANLNNERDAFELRLSCNISTSSEGKQRMDHHHPGIGIDSHSRDNTDRWNAEEFLD